jgi:hypothetical protein
MSARETANLCRVGSCKPTTMTAELVLPNGWRCASSSAPTRSPRPVGMRAISSDEPWHRNTSH